MREIERGPTWLGAEAGMRRLSRQVSAVWTWIVASAGVTQGLGLVDRVETPGARPDDQGRHFTVFRGGVSIPTNVYRPMTGLR